MTIATKSNYFRVKDGFAFRTWLNSRDLDYVIKQIKADGPYYAITSDLRGGFGWPVFDKVTRKDIDLPAELACHLLENDVAVLFEVSGEAGDHAAGSALAVRADGKTVSLKTSDIYALAAKAFGKNAVIEGMVA